LAATGSEDGGEGRAKLGKLELADERADIVSILAIARLMIRDEEVAEALH